ncbi:B12-binding domain-containing radical SAM protein [bacterium]|nr:B12-binding domain-containing radical SAM protein [bacterium]
MEKTTQTPQSLTMLFINPSRYDEEGYVIRYLRGVLPCNTLACMRSITLEFVDRWKKEKNIDISIKLFDEVIDVIPFERLARKNKGSNRVIAAIVGVQSNQFPRASDIAKKLTSLGIKTLIGGFHVSGIISMFGEPTPEIQELMDIGVTIVHGEAENRWEQILFDVVQGKEKSLYRMDEFPDFSQMHIPRPDSSYMNRFAIPHLGTLDCSRGCPFGCSFCTVINVQGHKMRHRSAERVLATISQNYQNGINSYFFTDDNFSRNPEWEKIFDGIIKFIEEDGLKISFLMQVDMKSHTIRNFVEKAARAGCTQVFIGMESLNPKNIEAVGKKQNNVDNYAEFIEAWHNSGVMTHVGYIIGFPYDTPESVREDIRRLKNDIKVDQASFFMLTPLPGSKDHYDMVVAGEYMDPDLNTYDSFHPSMNHPLMSREEWVATYNEAWQSFYSFENLKKILIRSGSKAYWNIFQNIMWYKNSLLEPRHPMVAGFVRRKHRTNIRPGTPVMPWGAFQMRRIRELLGGLKKRIAFFFELQELWLLTRKPDDPTFKFVADFTAYLAEAKNRFNKIKNNEEMHVFVTSLKSKILDYYDGAILRGSAKKRFNMLIGEMNLYFDRLTSKKHDSQSPTMFSPYLTNVIQQVENFSIKQVARRRKITLFWSLTLERLRHRRIVPFTFSIPKIILIALRDFRLSLSFAFHVMNRTF